MTLCTTSFTSIVYYIVYIPGTVDLRRLPRAALAPFLPAWYDFPERP